MTLDPRFIIASDLQSYFVDKDTGAPLSGGVITFYEDDSRTTPKSVYKLSGSPPNYSYVDLGNEITLSAVGTPTDGDGNDIVLYYFPYDGDQETSTGDIQLYYVTVTSEEGFEIPQFTREAWPNYVLASSSQINDTSNYIPNGQFLIHNNIPETVSTDAGQITEAITVLSQGGWTFERPESSTATDIVTFSKFEYVANPTSNPHYAFNLQTESTSPGDDYKDIRIKFDSVNQFASDTQTYTFAVEAIDNSGSGEQISLVLIKNFGTGGSAQEDNVIKSWDIDGSWNIYQFSFEFGVNSEQTIGPDGDDFIQLGIRFSVDSLIDVSLTNFQLRPNEVSLNEFVPTTEREFSFQTLTAPIPAYDGSNLFQTIKLGPNGLIYDNSEVGDVVMESNAINYVDNVSTITNRLLANGAQYDPTQKSPLGIPYSRLRDYYWIDSLQAPLYGTGSSYVTMYPTIGLLNGMRLTVNGSGLFPNAADGTVSTAFSFANIHVGLASFGCVGKSVGSSTFYIINETPGDSVAANAGTSGFTVSAYRKEPNVTNLVKSIIQVQTIAAAGLASTYFGFEFNVGVQYYVWFKVNGIGTDPAPGGTGILVNLLSIHTAQDVADIISEAVSALTITNINFSDGSTIIPGSYFTFSSSEINYYVWYKKDGVGTDPAPVGKTAIGPILALNDDTAIQVAQKTQYAINRLFFCVPNFQGLFPRGWDPSSVLDTGFRYSALTNYYGSTNIGTQELDEILQHIHTGSLNHTIVEDTAGSASPVGGSDYNSFANPAVIINPTGAYENRPYNFNVNFAIKY